MGVTYQVEMNAAIETVFRYVSEEDLMREWQCGFMENIYFHKLEGMKRKGATFVQRIHNGRKVEEYAGEIIAFHRPSFYGVRLESDYLTMEIFYRLIETEAGGTIVHFECIPTFNNWYTKAIRPFLHQPLRTMGRKQLEALKACLEQQWQGMPLESRV
ncbi:SRPBCC family protein [Halalkalibacterium halodurans]|uniref:SRPBCC family protein n=1 Tax=Halalkalibacterium halodurans TaxID=86665 RepID=UPI002AA965FE|nr:SRPBCC family protein [Halalkalibacterium halodurans]MDY7221175.1 SRPBCC family protein [Halalkalibacterium halodurans]MDY7240414.1 SRPBCC family protein [Halalkalibacterium halodurans]